jgi:hypothetical protein
MKELRLGLCSVRSRALEKFEGSRETLCLFEDSDNEATPQLLPPVDPGEIGG